MNAQRPTPRLPSAREPGRYRVAFVCLGNICRSPTADVVMQQLVDDAGLSEVIEVRSSGTAGWHIGKTMDDRAAATLSSRGYDPTRHRAQQFSPAWFDDDLILTMDHSNLSDVLALTGGAGPDQSRVRLFRDFDPSGSGAEVPDPYYGGQQGFEEVLTMVETTCAALLGAIIDQRVVTPE